MCSGISLSWRELPQSLIDRYELEPRVIVRSEGAEREIRFLYRDPMPLLPVWVGNRLVIRPWGNRNRRSKLPRTGWAMQEGLATWGQPEAVEIPATFGFDRGVWFQIRQGLRGIMLPDEQGQQHVYLLTEPASHYYRIMTRNTRMPVLIGERI